MVSLLHFSLFNFDPCRRPRLFSQIIVPSLFFTNAAKRKKIAAKNLKKVIAVKSVPVKNNYLNFKSSFLSSSAPFTAVC